MRGARPQECEITGVTTGIWAIYFRYEAYRGAAGRRCSQASIKFFKFHEATRMSRNSKALNSALIWCSCEIRAAKIRPSEFMKSFRKAANLARRIASSDQKDASGETLLNLAIAADDAAAIALDRGAEVNLASRGLYTGTARVLLQKRKYF